MPSLFISIQGFILVIRQERRQITKKELIWLWMLIQMVTIIWGAEFKIIHMNRRSEGTVAEASKLEFNVLAFNNCMEAPAREG
jgi:hypothetical protein